MTVPKYTQADWDTVSDNPEWTKEHFAQAVPFDQAFPDLAEKMRRARGQQKAPTKASTTIRLSRDVLDYFRAGGAGWQSRIDDVLKDWMANHR